MFIFISLLAMSIIGFIIHVMLESKPISTPRIVELLLLYQLVFSVGMTSLLAFFGLTFMGDFVAQYTGWPASPFEQQLGNVNLGYGVLGIMSIWFRGGFWVATVIGFSVWILSDGAHHFMQMIYEHDYMPGNIGVPLITDIIVPLVLLLLLAWHLKLSPLANGCQKA